ncbi:MAG TPA: nucleotide exchange factor GrpE [Rhodospirillaceae bacterium]|mgnify:CR=1 FL=1|jgi:molecular chaperone GrpE|nr:nucleotide exchange factor GrpE [Alphaproteobacteria bacterium]HBH25941.1 nucleotide exchange factor GrpE [Rhodospirillaceae bacterium]
MTETDEAIPEEDQDPAPDLEAALSVERDRALRALAEAENTRRRAERDVSEARDFAIARFARDVLEVADTLERALAAAPERDSALAQGVAATAQALHKALAKHGVARVEALGALFSPDHHEALFEAPASPDAPDGHVAQVLEEGYTLRGRLLRPARVAVARGGEAPAEPPPPAGSAVDEEA